MAILSTASWAFEARDSGEAERYRLQRGMVVGLVWGCSKTQEVFTALQKSRKLDAPVRHLRRAVNRKASLSVLKAAEQQLFVLIFAHAKNKQVIGSTLDTYVRGLFGQSVPWMTQELIQLFVSQLFAMARGQALGRHSRASWAERLPTIPEFPAGATLREQKAIIRRHHKALLHAALRTGGRAPKEKVPSVLRNAAWMYCHVVEGQSIHGLAREYKALTSPAATEGHYTGRALVQRAIRNTAQRLHLPAARPKSHR
ncbi:MAG: hypothetical protein Q8N04_03065 [Nitrospira sp.]|nr:hypothetical protein [Nitrospira sp.]